jgi:hypothetical protein
MARYDHLPIWKDAVALTALLEEVVRCLDANHPWFARYTQPPVAQIRSRRICPALPKIRPVAAAVLAAADATAPCPGAGTQLSENRFQAPGAPFALVAHAPGRYQPLISTL